MAKLRVFIVESLYPEDFYEERLDGRAARDVLKIENANVQYRIALDKKHLIRAIAEATSGNFDVLHVSCHGDTDGIGLSEYTAIDWLELAQLLRNFAGPGRILVMSSCAGGDIGLTKALEKTGVQIDWVFGAQNPVGFTDSCLAWSVLYRLLERVKGPCKPATAQQAVNAINSLVKGNFVYRRWDQSDTKYKVYPGYLTVKK